MKKRVFVLAAVFTILALVSAWATGAKEEGNKIIVWQSKMEIVQQLEAAAKAYQAETGVVVEVWPSSGDSYYQDLRIRMANNQGPSIFSVGQGQESAQMAAYMDDLSALPFINNIAPEILTKNSGGKPNAVPYTVEGFGWVYNKSLVNPSQVRNLASFQNFLREAKAKGINGFGLSQESYFLIGHILNTPFAVMSDMTGYMDRLNKGQVKMADTKEFQEFAQFMIALRDNSYNPLEVSYDRSCGDFATGKTAAIHQGNWCYSMFGSYNVNFDMGIMPFPLGGNDKLAVGVPNQWAVNSQVPEAQRKLAKDFLIWLYSGKGTSFLYNEFGFIPIVKGAVSTTLDPLSADVSRYTQEGKIIPWATNNYPAGIVDVHLVPVAQRFFASRMTAAEFLAALDQAWATANGR